MRVRVKVCGLTRVEVVLAAVNAGADAIGLVFYEKSPRNVDIETAAAIVRQLPAFVTVVGLFVNAGPAQVQRLAKELHLDLLQFHGDESPVYCKQIGLPYMKAIRVKEGTNLLQYASDYHDAKALLLDAYTEGVMGGTGHVFDWALIPDNLKLPVVLAGGLTPENVGRAIQQVKPYAVDVSGGVEAVVEGKQLKGIKDAAKMAAFMRGVSNASL